MSSSSPLIQQLKNLLDNGSGDWKAVDFLDSLIPLLQQELKLRLKKTESKDRAQTQKRLCYFSAEFLTGRLLLQNLQALNLKDEIKDLAAQHGLNLTEILEEEADPGLGNGGLGRLASCFLDSLSHMNLPATGYGICYRFGLFKQKIEGQRQVEYPDTWQDRDLWGIAQSDRRYSVPFGGTVEINCNPEGELQFKVKAESIIIATAMDYPVASSNSETVQPLRLWKASPSTAFNLDDFNHENYQAAWQDINLAESITAVLYPGDEGEEGKKLRLKQQYFFVSASLQDIVRDFRESGADWKTFPQRFVIQLNDTHPVLGIPELMRLLLDEEGMDWDQAWSICTQTFAYTNHTVLEEALEKWPQAYIKELFPRLMLIIEEIQRRLDLSGDNPRIIKDGLIHMASLAVHGSFSVNGVAALHSELLKDTVLKDWHKLYPQRFNNKTNGISHRRWLMDCNPGLTEFIDQRIGQDWHKSPLLLKGLAPYAEDKSSLQELRQIKQENKEKFSLWLLRNKGIHIPTDFLFDFQVKRIHEYKRQLLNLLSITEKYRQIKEGEYQGETAHCYFLGGKAAPGYRIAKEIIHMACLCAKIINKDPDCKGKLRLIFLEGYCVSMAEKIFPAAELSQQISTAGKEASGTGNMKFMMNGALTLGTRDGANIEIFQEAGEQNAIPFGMSVKEVDAFKESYSPEKNISENPRISTLLQSLRSGLINDKGALESLLNHLVYQDTYLVLPEVESHLKALDRSEQMYRDEEQWNRMSLYNISASGVFSSDRTIAEYASEIWKLSPRDC